MTTPPFTYRGQIDLKEFIEFYESNNIDWDEYTFRQDRFVCFEQTKTIPIIFNEEFSIDEIKFTKNYSQFEKPLENLSQQITNLIGEGQIQSCILVNLPSKKFIAEHIDTMKFAKIFKRLHIPIQTNEECLFFIKDEVKNLKVGEIWEIANDEYVHWVENKGQTDRVHMIIDWKEKSPTQE